MFVVICGAVVAFAAAVQAMPGLVGACATMNFTMQSIEPSEFVGAWYEIAHSASFLWYDFSYSYDDVMH